MGFVLAQHRSSETLTFDDQKLCYLCYFIHVENEIKNAFSTSYFLCFLIYKVDKKKSSDVYCFFVTFRISLVKSRR